MEITRFIYQDNPAQEVDFEPTGSDNVMVNATQMAAIFGKRLDAFLKSDHAKEFIKALETTPILGNSAPLKRKEIILSRGQLGTWMHRILALKFASWLNPEFELWVYTTIDTILNKFVAAQNEIRFRKLKAKAEMAQLKLEMIPKYPEAERYFQLEHMVKKADHEIITLVRDQIKKLQ